MSEQPPQAGSERLEPTFIAVPWTDERAVAIRDEFDAEMDSRYWDPDAPPAPPEVAQMLSEVFETRPEELVESILLIDPDGEPAGHGALFSRPEPRTLELRKVAIRPAYRRRGHARKLLAELERRAVERGAERIVLDTGPKQPDAIALYDAVGYRRIAPFPPYDRLGEGGAICFDVDLAARAAEGGR
ncbi:hypothetical protein USB125703_01266 [Pseudoclavibacter triregionum]|nr:hypothetical protein USB125703_01266 [Pseudoclavibacter triregionum]